MECSTPVSESAPDGTGIRDSPRTGDSVGADDTGAGDCVPEGAGDGAGTIAGTIRTIAGVYADGGAGTGVSTADIDIKLTAETVVAFPRACDNARHRRPALPAPAAPYRTRGRRRTTPATPSDSCPN